jgi:Caspase domain
MNCVSSPLHPVPRLLAAAVLMLLTLTAAPADWGVQLAGPGPAGERRIALVIGNSHYEMSPLTNPVNDARAMSDTLRRLGFEVTTLLDATEKQMVEAVRQFGDRTRSAGGVALFYYAGHGIQIDGTNYLIPVDAQLRKEYDVKYSTLNVNQVVDEMAYAKNRINIIILDACRNNPFARSFRSLRQGLAQIDASSGTLIAFATAPGSVASDGSGENGLYTENLLEQMLVAGAPVEEVFKRVRVGVMKVTKGEQVPWESSSLVGDFYFTPAAPTPATAPAPVTLTRPLGLPEGAAAAPAAPAAAVPPAPTAPSATGQVSASAAAVATSQGDAKDFERARWDTIKGSRNPEDYLTFLKTYPEGLFAALAKVRVRRYGGELPSAAPQSVPQTAAAPVTPQAPPPAAPATVALPAYSSPPGAADTAYGTASSPSSTPGYAPPSSFNHGPVTAYAQPSAYAPSSAYGAPASHIPSGGPARPSSYAPPPRYAPPAATAGLLVRARSAMDGNRLTTPPDDNAAKWSHAVLALDADNAEAKGLLREIVARYLEWTERDLDRGRVRKAEISFGRASGLLEYASDAQVALAERLRSRISAGRGRMASTPAADDYAEPEPDQAPAYTPPPTYRQRRTQDDAAAAMATYMQTIEALAPPSTVQKLRQVPAGVPQSLMRLLGR